MWCKVMLIILTYLRSGIAIGIMFILAGCMSSPVTNDHWDGCKKLCAPDRVAEACTSVYSEKMGCKCTSERLIFFTEAE